MKIVRLIDLFRNSILLTLEWIRQAHHERSSRALSRDSSSFRRSLIFLSTMHFVIQTQDLAKIKIENHSKMLLHVTVTKLRKIDAEYAWDNGLKLSIGAKEILNLENLDASYDYSIRIKKEGRSDIATGNEIAVSILMHRVMRSYMYSEFLQYSESDLDKPKKHIFK